VIWVIHFFKDLGDAKKFYDEMKAPKVLGVARTAAYGLCYFVSVGFSQPKTLRELHGLGDQEHKIAEKYGSFLGAESALKPDDVSGIIDVISSNL